jgi:hypothetical protein
MGNRTFQIGLIRALAAKDFRQFAGEYSISNCNKPPPRATNSPELVPERVFINYYDYICTRKGIKYEQSAVKRTGESQA